MQEVLSVLSVDTSFVPVFIDLNTTAGEAQMQALLSEKPYIKLSDSIQAQLTELIKCRNLGYPLSKENIAEKIAQHLGTQSARSYGVWVYYPWSERLVHLLGREEFAELRTNRNKFKITAQEQALLSGKKVGVIGLSVGQSVALTLAMERGFGELRIADFDELDLTNLNRIRTGVHHIGIKKTVIVAREIAEIDPYLNVTCFHDGINNQNMDAFLLENGKLDVLIDECDSVDIKINCRIAAKKHHIPVLMETSDRGLVDVERFDLEPERPILHGFIDHLDFTNISNLKTFEEKLPFVLPIAGIATMSKRMKASAIEIGQSISSWPQLASAVTMGGGVAADVCRRILLNQYTASGRYYVDLDDLIGDPKPSMATTKEQTAAPLSAETMHLAAMALHLPATANTITDAATINTIVHAAGMAPSIGNLQPWKFYFNAGTLYLFRDAERVHLAADYHNLNSWLSLGAAIENIYLKCSELGLRVQHFPYSMCNSGSNNMVAAFRFYDDAVPSPHSLAAFLQSRCTNRNPGNGVALGNDAIQALLESVRQFSEGKLILIDNKTGIGKLADLAGKLEKLNMFSEEGHSDGFERQLRFSDDSPAAVKEGLDIRTMGLSPKDQVAFRVLQDMEAMKLVNDWSGGAALEKITCNLLASAAVVGVFTMPTCSVATMLEAGRAMEHLWLTATAHGIAFQPIATPINYLLKLSDPGSDPLPERLRNELILLHDEFINITELDVTKEKPLFLFRMCYAPTPKLKAQRSDLENIYYYNS
jgi:nitroreductase/molybdopterin/thiamine biosynthesis adenylyltransferase